MVTLALGLRLFFDLPEICEDLTTFLLTYPNDALRDIAKGISILVLLSYYYAVTFRGRKLKEVVDGAPAAPAKTKRYVSMATQIINPFKPSVRNCWLKLIVQLNT